MQIYWRDGRITSSVLNVEMVSGLGFFDGMHLGHQAIASQVVELAASLGRVPALVTFDRHPLSIVKPEAVPLLLTTAEERRQYMWDLGIEAVVELVFDGSLARLEPEEFVKGILVGQLKVIAVAAGEDFTFGNKSRGTTELLAKDGPSWGLKSVIKVPPVEAGGEKVSSTRIRRLLQEGDVEAAAELLGRPYRLAGPVIQGEGRGRTLGFPTANLKIEPHQLIPREGVYAVTVRERAADNTHGDAQRQVLIGVLSISTKPTFDGSILAIEVHVLDHKAAYYGKELEVSFHHFLRPIQKFANSHELQAQVDRDIQAARKLLPASVIGTDQSSSEKIYSL